MLIGSVTALHIMQHCSEKPKPLLLQKVSQNCRLITRYALIDALSMVGVMTIYLALVICVA